MKQHSKQYQEYIGSLMWYLKTLEVFERAGGKCEKCGKSGMIEVHHKTYDHLGDEPLEDLIALCHDCHIQADAQRQREKENEIYLKRLDGWARKVYGDDWQLYRDFEEVSYRFDAWLESQT